MRFLLVITLSCCVAAPAGAASADVIRVASASNFREAMTELAREFEAGSGHEVTLSFGASGKHYAQISNGAPFDAFFSADAERPGRLEDQGLAVKGSRFTYALGRLVLWSTGHEPVTGGAVLSSPTYRHLAIANPQLAPYGKAARETLQALGAWESAENRLVLGENVGQAFQFVYTGNAEIGLVAWSQLQSIGKPQRGAHWLVPDDLHQPIEQQAVLISDSVAAREFMAFVQSEKADAIIRAHGYETP